MTSVAATHSETNLAVIACPTCGRVHADEPLEPGHASYCTRCGARLSKRTPASLHLTAALALSALLLYIPANVFPILYLELYGRRASNTVLDGVRVFYHDGLYAMAVVVLLASVVIPVVKIAGLLYLVVSTWVGSRRNLRFRTRVFAFIDSIGRWAMLDVFVLGIWVATVKMRTVGNVIAGEGLLPFGGVVVFTLLAASCFDPKLMWEKEPGTA